MPLFAVIADTVKPGLKESVAKVAAESMPLNDRVTIAKFDGAAKAFYDKLTIPENERSGILIVQLSADYYGLSNRPFWDWLATGFREGADG